MHARIGSFHRGSDGVDQDGYVGPTKTNRLQPLNTTFDTGELFLGTSDSSGAAGARVLVNTDLVMNIDSLEQLTNRIGRL
ncbi:hypothetical protein ANCDUO_23391 [Ancylostoma duodenale]|uniref:Uncharacterized protein n=1 Tax=Ancylostoma duodenale TaxID=51022 RepID=A0A0C2FNW7_9BILA|nr:hypothetical protein ANCDUO_23391 [Ancylostoma duodenale]